MGKEWKKSFEGGWDRGEEVEQGEGGAEDGFVAQSPDLGLNPEMLELSEVLEVGMRARIGRTSMGCSSSPAPAHLEGFPSLAQLSQTQPCFPLLRNISQRGRDQIPAGRGRNNE